MNKELRAKGLELAYIEYKPMLYKLSHKYKNVYNNDFEEAFADSSLWFIESFDSYDKDRSNFSTYLHMYVESRFIDVARKNKKIQTKNTNIDDFDCDDLIFEDHDEASSDLTKIEMTKGEMARYKFYVEHQDLLDVLDDRTRDIFKLYYYNSWSIAEIAEMFNLSEIRVKKIKSKALDMITKEMKEVKDLQGF